MQVADIQSAAYNDREKSQNFQYDMIDKLQMLRELVRQLREAQNTHGDSAQRIADLEEELRTCREQLRVAMQRREPTQSHPSAPDDGTIDALERKIAQLEQEKETETRKQSEISMHIKRLSQQVYRLQTQITQNSKKGTEIFTHLNQFVDNVTDMAKRGQPSAAPSFRGGGGNTRATKTYHRNKTRSTKRTRSSPHSRRRRRQTRRSLSGGYRYRVRPLSRRDPRVGKARRAKVKRNSGNQSSSPSSSTSPLSAAAANPGGR